MERGGEVTVPAITQPPADFQTIRSVFETLLEHEIMVTDSINEIVYTTLQEKDYTTHNFMQWFVAEQIEEEALARTINYELPGNYYFGLGLKDLYLPKSQNRINIDLVYGLSTARNGYQSRNLLEIMLNYDF